MSAAGPIRLVISDVDGTIVTKEKILAPGTIAAAQRLRAAEVGLAIVSARPPRGMAWISETLELTAPYAGFNGGLLIGPGGAVVEWNPAPAALVHRALDLFAAQGVDAWLFTAGEWLVRDAEGIYVAHETHTVRFAPRVVADFGPYAGEVGKLVGVSDDFDRLAAVEAELQAIVGDGATAHRSQKYYLDLTHRNANKGYAVQAIARHAGVPTHEVAVLGDQANDLPMFAVAGLSVAMGNGTDAVKASATAITGSNDAEGWAAAIDTLVLPRAPGRVL